MEAVAMPGAPAAPIPGSVLVLSHSLYSHVRPHPALTRSTWLSLSCLQTRSVQARKSLACMRHAGSFINTAIQRPSKGRPKAVLVDWVGHQHDEHKNIHPLRRTAFRRAPELLFAADPSRHRLEHWTPRCNQCLGYDVNFTTLVTILWICTGLRKHSACQSWANSFPFFLRHHVSSDKRFVRVLWRHDFHRALSILFISLLCLIHLVVHNTH